LNISTLDKKPFFWYNYAYQKKRFFVLKGTKMSYYISDITNDPSNVLVLELTEYETDKQDSIIWITTTENRLEISWKLNWGAHQKEYKGLSIPTNDHLIVHGENGDYSVFGENISVSQHKIIGAGGFKIVLPFTDEFVCIIPKRTGNINCEWISYLIDVGLVDGVYVEERNIFIVERMLPCDEDAYDKFYKDGGRASWQPIVESFQEIYPSLTWSDPKMENFCVRRSDKTVIPIDVIF
jgi:hypothetical protein